MFGTKGCEFCCSWFHSDSEPKMLCFLRFLPVEIFFELCLSRWSVLPLFWDRYGMALSSSSQNLEMAMLSSF